MKALSMKKKKPQNHHGSCISNQQIHTRRKHFKEKEMLLFTFSMPLSLSSVYF